jgi:glycosyltransferase involved in cell wall biosynthesis
MKITIITVCYNSAKTIEDAIKSVLMQTYPSVEYIVIDGASFDGTRQIISKYESSIDVIVSEEDGGIYDAMNKGILLAKGEVVAFLNSDDFYAESGAISAVMDVFINNSIDICYGDLCYVDFDHPQKVIRYWRSGDSYGAGFSGGWSPAHPSFFVRTDVYRKYGLFDTKIKIANDIELMYRFMELHKLQYSYLKKVIVYMRLGGQSNKNLRTIFYQNSEIVKFIKKSDKNFSILKYILGKLLIRVKQFISKPDGY